MTAAARGWRCTSIEPLRGLRLLRPAGVTAGRWPIGSGVGPGGRRAAVGVLSESRTDALLADRVTLAGAAVVG